jgi:hypothetical protein
MVRRGSTVRVRQRALQKPRSQGFAFRIDLHVVEREAGMEPFGAFRSKRRPRPHFGPSRAGCRHKLLRRCVGEAVHPSYGRSTSGLRTPRVPVADHAVAGRLCLKVRMRGPVSSTRGWLGPSPLCAAARCVSHGDIPLVSTRAERLSATAPRRSAPSDRLVAGDAGGGLAAT